MVELEQSMASGAGEDVLCWRDTHTIGNRKPGVRVSSVVKNCGLKSLPPLEAVF